MEHSNLIVSYKSTPIVDFSKTKILDAEKFISFLKEEEKSEMRITNTILNIDKILIEFKDLIFAFSFYEVKEGDNKNEETYLPYYSIYNKKTMDLIIEGRSFTEAVATFIIITYEGKRLYVSIILRAEHSQGEPYIFYNQNIPMEDIKNIAFKLKDDKKTYQIKKSELDNIDFSE